MNALLELVSDFVERVANAEHGPAINDAYGLALERALRDDPGLAERFASVDSSDVWTLSSAGWWWFLNEAQAQNYKLADDFLAALYARSRSPLLRYKVVETSLRLNERMERRELPRWLIAEIESLAQRNRHEELDAGEELLRALLQLGDDAARAAFALLAQVRGDLRERAFILLENVDPEVRAQWLGPPERGPFVG